MESPSKGEQVAKTEFAAPRSSAPSLLSSLLSAPRTGLGAGMNMVMSLPGAFGQGPGILYSGATNAMNVTCEMIKTRIPNLPFGSDWTGSDHEEDSLSLDLDENHFAAPEAGLLKCEEDLIKMIEFTKDEIMNKFDNLEERRTLVSKLIELRLQLQELKEKKEERVTSIVVKEHKFESISPMKLKKGRVFCEACSGLVWIYLQSWYRCIGCGYVVHGRCTESVRRVCAAFRIKESKSLITKICPEKGLHNQIYACVECGTVLSRNYKASEPRLCDYTGLYFCPTCHWNKKSIIPARVIHNWDFKPRPVSNGSYQYLRIMEKVAVINMDDLNHKIFGLVEELDRLKELRQIILAAKEYLIACETAANQRILSVLKHRSHFIETSASYSLADLIDLESGVLLPFIENIVGKFEKHIEVDCKELHYSATSRQFQFFIVVKP
ncbi:differentially expressed in FDCP 8 homolog isoform X2 [Artemia franciscana]|uniref:differentially expressed in FDCP 8 homolog isoform X2 n=1 Tax=Artemia franciscana TaxID=6661 RepID=UPI0032D9C8EC